MGIDIFVLVMLAIGVFKGLQKGLVVGIFSFVGLIVGAAAALKFSGVAADFLAGHFPNLGKWIPFLSFLLVFLLVIIAVRLIAGFIEKTMDWTMMGWVNKLGGIVFFSIIYLVLTSIMLFYADKAGMISATAKSDSKTYAYMSALAPVIMDGLGVIIPFFKDMFGQLEKAFDEMAKPAN